MNLGSIKAAKIENHRDTEALTAEGNTSCSSSDESSPIMRHVKGSKALAIDGIEILDTADLHHAPSTLLAPHDADYPPVNNFQDAKYIFFLESNKIWAIAVPIAFNILCNYGINSFTNIFVGHIGDLELSAVSIALSVVSNFSFGFLVSALQTIST